MDFEKICMMFTMQEPYYGILLSSMQRIPDKNVSTLGIGKSGNVFSLHYNEDYMKKLTVDEALTCLKHECLHLAFNHLTMWEDTKDYSEHLIRNYAMDLEVNGYLDQSKIANLNGLLAKDFGWADRLGTREYYSLLKKEAEDQTEQQQKQNGSSVGTSSKSNPNGQTEDDKQKEPSGSQGQNKCSEDEEYDENEDNSAQQEDDDYNFSSGQRPIDEDVVRNMTESEVLDNHSDWPDTDDDEQTQQLQSQIDSMLDMAATEVEKNCGSIPAEMRMRIEQIRKKPKPVADWKRYFRRYLGNEFTELLRKSKKRESRRFPDAAGNRHQRKSHILVAIDTSGSVSMPEFREFFGQIKTLTSRADFHVVECDTRIAYEYDFKNKPNEDLHGGGGTSFQEPVDMFINNRKRYDALVYFTDGYAYIPKNTPKDTLWVISSNGDQSDRRKYQVNGASVAFIPRHD